MLYSPLYRRYACIAIWVLRMESLTDKQQFRHNMLPTYPGHLEEGAEYIIPHEHRCAALASDTFRRLMGDSDYYKHKTNLAVFILERDVGGKEENESVYEVVALGTGATCFQGWQEYEGLLVHDSHALVVARRALIRYLYKEIYLYSCDLPEAQEKCIFCPSQQSQFLVLKPNTYLYLYINYVPERVTPLQNCWDVQSTVPLSINSKGSLGSVSSCPPSVLAARVCCMSSTDKLMKWNILGIQGALLSQFVEPIYLTSVVVGATEQQFNTLSQAVTDRLQPPPDLSLFPSYDVQSFYMFRGPSCYSEDPTPIYPTHSINWCKGDKDVEIVDGSTGKPVESTLSPLPCPGSRICKAAMLMYYLDVCRLLKNEKQHSTYQQAKALSDQYQHVKSQLYSHLNAAGLGMWPRKLCVDRLQAIEGQDPDGESWFGFQCDLY